MINVNLFQNIVEKLYKQFNINKNAQLKLKIYEKEHFIFNAFTIYNAISTKRL